MSKLKTNRNGVTYYLEGSEVHASYYIAEDVTLSKVFTDLSKQEIDNLNIDDFK